MFANTIYYISVTLLIVSCLTVIVFAIFPIKMKTRYSMMLFNIIVIALAAFSFFAEPSFSTDAYFYYEKIDIYRNSEILDLGTDALPVWRLILKAVSLTNYNGFLPASCVLIWGVCVGSVIKDYLKKHESRSQAIMLYYLALFGGCSIYMMISGLRNTLVCAIVFCAYYFFYSHRKFKYYSMVLLSILIHPFAFIIFAIIELYERVIKNLSRSKMIFAVCIVVLIGVLSATNLPGVIFSWIPGHYGQLLSGKWQSYQEYNGAMSIIELIRWGWVLYFMVLLVVDIRKQQKLSFFSWIVFLTCALSPLQIVFERFPYLIGISSFELINKNHQSLAWNSRILYSIISFVVFFILFFYFLYSMMAHIEFNGHNYHDVWNSLFFS